MTWSFRRMATSIDRVLASFVRDQEKPINAKFTESVLDKLGLITGHEMPIYVELANNKLLLGNKPMHHLQKPVKIRRPYFCPIHNMTKEQKTELPAETLDRGIDVGCAVVLEAGDGKILLTRRANHLRTFPNVWVPPGGHVEKSETMTEAGLRELMEETGLNLSQEQCQDKRLNILALWESVYPPMLSSGLPTRHHIVVYLHAKLTSNLTSDDLQTQLNLDPKEVGASIWIDRKIAQQIVIASEGTLLLPKQKLSREIPETIPITVVKKDGTTADENLSTSILLQTAPGGDTDVERVSTGTKFALEEWLARINH